MIPERKSFFRKPSIGTGGRKVFRGKIRHMRRCIFSRRRAAKPPRIKKTARVAHGCNGLQKQGAGAALAGKNACIQTFNIKNGVRFDIYINRI